MKRILVALCLFVFWLPSCSNPPSDSDRAKVANLQQTYETEFLGAVNQSRDIVPKNAFSGTVAAIEATRPGASNLVVAYLDVLQGIIYLQTGQMGLARTMLGPIGKAAAVLKPARAEYPRDALIALAYPDLVAGTDAVGRVRELIDGNDSEAEFAALKPQRDVLLNAAGGVRSSLCRARSRGHIATSSDVDGATLLAGYAASFWASADDAAAVICLSDTQDSDICPPYLESRPSLVSARDVQATFTSPGVSSNSYLVRQQSKISTSLKRWASKSGRAMPGPKDACG